MTTYRELVYMCLDLIKGTSDDFTYTEEHIVYLLDKYRALLLKQRYGNDPKKYIPASNYSNILVAIEDNKSAIHIPQLMNIGIIRVTPFKEDLYSIDVGDYYDYTIEYVVKERFPFVGNNTKYLKNIKYCTIDSYGLMMTKGIESATFTLTAILETPLKENGLDSEFPLEESLIPNLIQMVLKDLYPATQRPADPQNNANDDIATLAQYLNTLLKSKYKDTTDLADDE